MSIYKGLLKIIKQIKNKIKTHIFDLDARQKSETISKTRINKGFSQEDMFPYTEHIETVVCLKHR